MGLWCGAFLASETVYNSVIHFHLNYHACIDALAKRAKYPIGNTHWNGTQQTEHSPALGMKAFQCLPYDVRSNGKMESKNGMNIGLLQHKKSGAHSQILAVRENDRQGLVKKYITSNDSVAAERMKRMPNKLLHNNIFIQIGGFEYVGNLIGN